MVGSTVDSQLGKGDRNDKTSCGGVGAVYRSDLATGLWPTTAMDEHQAYRAGAHRAAAPRDDPGREDRADCNPSAPNTDLPGCGFQPLGRHIEGIPRLAIPTFREINGGNGVRGGDCLPEPTATGFPSAPLAAATFNPALNFAWGAIVGQETRNFAHQVLLGPAMNLIRHPYTGRAQEYPSEDPYLAGVIATEQTKGIQSRGTHAMIKHFVANDDEGGNCRALDEGGQGSDSSHARAVSAPVRDGDQGR